MMEPVPETREALIEYFSMDDEADLEQWLTTLGVRAQQVVPQLVALSVALVEDDITFTLAAPGLAAESSDTAEEHPAQVVGSADGEVLDERRWLIEAQTVAVQGIASTLSMSTVRDGRRNAVIDLYASTDDAFVGKENALATALGMPAGRPVSNADLSFSTRRSASEAPKRLREQTRIDTVVGLLAAQYGDTPTAARDRLRGAADASGIEVATLAHALLELRWQGSQ